MQSNRALDRISDLDMVGHFVLHTCILFQVCNQCRCTLKFLSGGEQEIHNVGVSVVRGQFDAAHRSGERVVQLMRHDRSDLAHGGHAFGVQQLWTERLLLAQVAQHADDSAVAANHGSCAEAGHLVLIRG